MPIAQVYLMEGRSEDQRRAVIEKVTDALCEALAAPREAVRVLIVDVPRDSWGIGGRPAKDLGR